MKPNSMLTLFSSYPSSGDKSVPLMLSALIHGMAFLAIASVLVRAPRIVAPPRQDRYSARYLDIDRLDFQLGRLSATNLRQHERADKRLGTTVAEQLSAFLHPTRAVAEDKVRAHTLLQPDLPKQVTVNIALPVPQIVIWKRGHANIKSIVAPLPEPSHASDANPSILSPNDESPLGTISVAATNVPTIRGQSPPASTTPTAYQQAAMVQKPPMTVSQLVDKPTPVAIMSLSGLRMSNERIVLPPVNESAGSPQQNAIVATMPSPAGTGTNGSTNPTGREKGGFNATIPGKSSIEMRLEQHDVTSSKEGNFASGAEHNTSATLITLPPSGQFAAVVVGTSPDDRFPEIERQWSGRLIYTVYLHVGLAHSWILQYSLPRSTEAIAGGRVNRLESPWPYSMVRPELDFASIDADALILNGLITQDGTFDRLSLVSPPSFPQYDFVIHCLQRWQFRPATQDGHTIAVEVMLIIPAPQT